MIDAARFKGRNAVVTGAASGIGLAVAERLIAEGARVSLWDRDAERLQELVGKLGAAAQGLALDLADPAPVERVAHQTATALGGIDILVTSAGITGPTAALADYPIDDGKQAFAVNVHAM